jgi:hypothetical protein
VTTFLSTAIGTQSYLLSSKSVSNFVYPEGFSNADQFLSKFSNVDSILEPLHLGIPGGYLVTGSLCAWALYRYLSIHRSKERENPEEDNTMSTLLASYVSGIIFSLGLSISGM